MNSHMESVHEKKKPYKCDICDANFTEKQGMVSHIQSVHEGINLSNVTFVMLRLHKNVIQKTHNLYS